LIGGITLGGNTTSYIAEEGLGRADTCNVEIAAVADVGASR
jgi:hypothetical protein